MKKLIIFLLMAFMLLFSFASCETDDKDKSDDKKDSSETSDEEKNPSNTDDEKEKIVITRGKFDGAVYTNEILGFKFVRPESWVYSTDEEIAALVNLSAEMIGGENFAEALKNSATVFDMMVVDSATKCNLNVGYENLAKSQMTNITVQQYVDALERNFALMPNMSVEFPDQTQQIKLGESEFTRVVCNTTTQGVSITQVFYLKKVDKYMCLLTVTLTDGYEVSDIEEMFSSISNDEK